MGKNKPALSSMFLCCRGVCDVPHVSVSWHNLAEGHASVFPAVWDVSLPLLRRQHQDRIPGRDGQESAAACQSQLTPVPRPSHLTHLRSTTKLNKSTHAGYYLVCSGSSWPSQMHHFISFSSSELWNGPCPGRVLICSVWPWSRESAEPGEFYEWTGGEICCCCITFRKTIEIKCIPARQTRAAYVSGKAYCFTFREAECDWEMSLMIGLKCTVV